MARRQRGLASRTAGERRAKGEKVVQKIGADRYSEKTKGDWGTFCARAHRGAEVDGTRTATDPNHERQHRATGRAGGRHDTNDKPGEGTRGQGPTGRLVLTASVHIYILIYIYMEGQRGVPQRATPWQTDIGTCAWGTVMSHSTVALLQHQSQRALREGGKGLVEWKGRLKQKKSHMSSPVCSAAPWRPRPAATVRTPEIAATFRVQGLGTCHIFLFFFHLGTTMTRAALRSHIPYCTAAVAALLHPAATGPRPEADSWAPPGWMPKRMLLLHPCSALAEVG